MHKIIISASYRTDIPAHHAAWFKQRLAAGFCDVANPYGGPDATVPLGPDRVAGFVFWTRNIAPFEAALAAVRAQGSPFVVHVTVTGYPRALERGVIDAETAVDQIWALSRRHGRRGVVWRYDPIVLTSLTPPAWHRRNFAALARALGGACDEVVVSFVQIYRKTRRNLTAAAAREGFDWRDADGGVDWAEKRALLATLTAIAAENGLRLTVCSQPEAGGAPARCIDAARLSDVAGAPITAAQHGNRPGCACHRARDIGAYDSCVQGCVYCYAVTAPRRAAVRLRQHDPAAQKL